MVVISSTRFPSLARRLAVKNGLVADQRTWSGLVKEKEASHDAAVGRACRAEIEALARQGAKVRRIWIDAELKSVLAGRSETARAREGKAEADRERRLAAAELQLPIDRDGHVLVPDAQLEYTDAAGQILIDFMGRLGIFSTYGYGRRRLRDQMERLFACSISLIYRGDGRAVRTRSLIADHAKFRWDYKQPAASALFPSEITLGYVHGVCNLQSRLLKTESGGSV